MMNNSQSTLIKSSLRFLHDIWWRVQIEGLDRLPEHGPVFIVGNTSGSMPWPALMLNYAMTMHSNNGNQRRLNVFTNMDIITDERIYLLLRSLNCMPWSYDTAKQFIDQGEVLVIFPEQTSSVSNGSRHLSNRLRYFDWTKFLPAIEAGVPIYPLATLGMDEMIPTSCAMRLIEAIPYKHIQERELVKDEAKKIALFAEGEIQAELNRLLRKKRRAK